MEYVFRKKIDNYLEKPLTLLFFKVLFKKFLCYVKCFIYRRKMMTMNLMTQKKRKRVRKEKLEVKERVVKEAEKRRKRRRMRVGRYVSIQNTSRLFKILFEYVGE